MVMRDEKASDLNMRKIEMLMAISQTERKLEEEEECLLQKKNKLSIL